MTLCCIKVFPDDYRFYVVNGKKSARQKSHSEVSLVRSDPTVKFPQDEISLQRSDLTVNCPTTKCHTAKVREPVKIHW